ncbi:uncharacterized protein LOC115203843 [Salmo trutta]|uniref:uncharacterized protein LOC115203843 n=1 Tax=Salmo trutta TaxID=8032 RepID=UPI001131F495|nr:uncharacterized protein LOC115203843 [Salmo trutta]
MPILSTQLSTPPPPPFLLLLSSVDALTCSMDSGGEREEGWMEDQWEKWTNMAIDALAEQITLSHSVWRLTHDISLNEFEDEDLSEITEITDECGMSLNCNGLEIKGCVRRGHNSVVGKAELGAVGQLQAEMLHLDLIDGADGYHDDKESSKPSSTAPLPVTEDPTLETMDIYRPKRPTTLNLFPMVPHTQAGAFPCTVAQSKHGVQSCSMAGAFFCAGAQFRYSFQSRSMEGAFIGTDVQARAGVQSRSMAGAFLDTEVLSRHSVQPGSMAGSSRPRCWRIRGMSGYFIPHQSRHLH